MVSFETSGSMHLEALSTTFEVRLVVFVSSAPKQGGHALPRATLDQEIEIPIFGAIKDGDFSS